MTKESSNHYSYPIFVVRIRSSLERHESPACCTLLGVLDQEIVLLLLLQHHHMMNTRQTPLMCVCVYIYIYLHVCVCIYIPTCRYYVVDRRGQFRAS